MIITKNKCNRFSYKIAFPMRIRRKFINVVAVVSKIELAVMTIKFISVIIAAI